MISPLRSECRDRSATILAFHPLGHTGAFFDDFAALLPKHVAFRAPDLLGHGSCSASQPDKFDDFVTHALAELDSCEDGAVHLFGHSLGGAVAASLIERADPKRVSSLTLVATPYFGVPEFAARAVAVRDGGMGSVLDKTLERWLGAGRLGPAEARARTALLNMRPEAYDAVWRAFAGFEGFGKIERTFPPTWVIAFAEDVSTPPAMQDRIAEAVSATGASVRRADVADAAHLGMLQRCGEVAAIFSDHLDAIGACP